MRDLPGPPGPTAGPARQAHRAGQKRQRHDDARDDPALPNPIGFGPSPPRHDATPRRRPSYGTLEQGVIDRDRQRRSGRNRWPRSVVNTNPTSRSTTDHGEESVRAAVVPELPKPAPMSIPHTFGASLAVQTNNQADERAEGRSGKAGPEAARRSASEHGRGAGKHRRITLTMVVQAPSMLSPSPTKIADWPSPRVATTCGGRDLRKTAKTRGPSTTTFPVRPSSRIVTGPRRHRARRGNARSCSATQAVTISAGRCSGRSRAMTAIPRTGDPRGRSDRSRYPAPLSARPAPG